MRENKIEDVILHLRCPRLLREGKDLHNNNGKEPSRDERRETRSTKSESGGSMGASDEHGPPWKIDLGFLPVDGP